MMRDFCKQKDTNRRLLFSVHGSKSKFLHVISGPCEGLAIEALRLLPREICLVAITSPPGTHINSDPRPSLFRLHCANTARDDTRVLKCAPAALARYSGDSTRLRA